MKSIVDNLKSPKRPCFFVRLTTVPLCNFFVDNLEGKLWIERHIPREV